MDLYSKVTEIDLSSTRQKQDVLNDIIRAAELFEFSPVEIVLDKPWGAMVRFDSKNADIFIQNFFPGLDIYEARLGRDDMELSPKFLLVTQGERLSWQLHHRRAERWSYVTQGAYYKSNNPEDLGILLKAKPGEMVQFEQGECHRLVGDAGDTYTLVAEIWQHTDPECPSDEEDIIRLRDDYKR